MSFTVSITGAEELQRELRKASDEAVEAVQNTLMATAVRLRSEGMRIMYRTPAKGRYYDRKNGITHRASAAGDPPAVDTGRLANSSNWNIKEEKLRVTIGSDLVYALYLELGTREMMARPLWTPLLMKNEKKFKQDVSDALGVALS